MRPDVVVVGSGPICAVAAQAICVRSGALTAPKCAQIELADGARVEPRWMDLGFAHVMGTCRMGEVDNGNSVADGFGRVWGTDNLYLATVGLIPTALAIRSADHALNQ
jgi:choline dehydrogenase-like flavoprotein